LYYETRVNAIKRNLAAIFLFATTLRPVQRPTQPSLLPVDNGRSVKLTTNLQLLLKLRMRGALPTLPMHLLGVLLRHGDSLYNAYETKTLIELYSLYKHTYSLYEQVKVGPVFAEEE
jgi:hypothetical protein